MKTGIVIAAVAVAVFAVVGVYMVDIDQTQEAVLPEVAIEGGQMPEFDAEVGNVDITEETVTVTSLENTTPEQDNLASN